jgi:hypothetical protein
VDGCFDLCDRDAKCAAARFTFPTDCFVYKFGFEQVQESNGSVSYIKPEVKTEMANLDKLNETFSIVKQHTPLYGHNRSVDTLTPSACFNKCKMSRGCGGAAFTIDTSVSRNCFMFPVDGFKQSRERKTKIADVKLWTAFIKYESTNTVSDVKLYL